jgi:phospholipid/cholesterol/gamma-HCH transport system substrate-binding protein
MESKREQALVGVFVLVAAGLLIATVFALTGAFSSGDNTFRAYFPFAGGLEPGGTVRYAGGPPVGRIETVRADPQDPTRMEIVFHVHRSTPVKTDSKAKISSLSALGDNYLEIEPGTAAASAANPNDVLQSIPYVSFDQLVAKLNDMAPTLNDLMKNMNGRVTQLKDTLDNVNDLLDERNRRNISASLAQIRGMLDDDRPLIHSTLDNVSHASAKFGPLLDDFKRTVANANEAISHLDSILTKNSPNLEKSISDLKQAMAYAVSLLDQLDRTLSTNSENIDDIIENFRRISENLKEFTDTIKTRPYTLIRSSSPPPRQPGEKPKPGEKQEKQKP